MLETIWFILWGLLWAIFFTLDGFDFGIGSLLPVLGKSESDRRLMYRAMGPFWDGNQVWLITAGGVTFAAFPKTYAVMFSSLYSALLLVLFTLILRGVAIEFRNKVDSPAWRNIWDWGTFLGSILPALLFGVAFANIFKGIPINAEGVNQSGLFGLLNWYGLLGGVLFVLLFLVHGALWLASKTEGDLQDRAGAMVNKLWPALLVVAAAFLAASAVATKLWDNYFSVGPLFVLPLAAVGCLVMIKVKTAARSYLTAWGYSAGTIIFCTLFGVMGMFPDLLPSTLNPKWSLTAFNSSSSPLTLKIMLGVALVMVPVVIIYQYKVHRFFGGRISSEDAADHY